MITKVDSRHTFKKIFIIIYSLYTDLSIELWIRTCCNKQLWRYREDFYKSHNKINLRRLFDVMLFILPLSLKMDQIFIHFSYI